jgi:phytanoyl-CoA hydroxylase
MVDPQTDNNKEVAIGAAGGYPEWLYRYAAVVTAGIPSLEAVGDEAVRSFHERGYLVVHQAFTPAETRQGLQGLVDLIDGGNPDFAGVQFEKAALDKLEQPTSEERQAAVRKLFSFSDYDARLKALADHPKLLAVLRRLIGEDQLTMFQDMALLKPPFIGREKPWHQDMAYFNLPLSTTVVGVWIALDEATVDNACMMVIPGSQQRGAVIHFKRRDWQICDTDVLNDGAVAIPLKPGDCLFFHGLIHHGTPANRSDRQRRALQFHYRAANVEETSEEEHREVFGSEGKGVSC